MKNWTTKEIQYLKKNALLAETNIVLNVEELNILQEKSRFCLMYLTKQLLNTWLHRII